MIARVLRQSETTKSSMRRLANYLMDTKGSEERVLYCSAANATVLEDGRGYGLSREEMDDVVLEMLHTQSLNTRAKGDRTYHLVLSFHEDLDLDTLRRLEEEVVRELGMDDLQRISVVHGDTDHLHIHLAINLIHPDRHTIMTPWQAETKLQKICAEMEQKYALIPDNHERTAEACSSRATTMEFCGDIESLTGWLQRNCRQALKDAKSWEEIHALLAGYGIRIVPSTRGLAFTNGSIHVRASAVDRSLSKAKLEKRLGAFLEEGVAENIELRDKTYTAGPMKHGVDTSALWAQYCEERQFLKDRRKEAEKALSEELRTELGRTFRDLTLAGIAARYFVIGIFWKKLGCYLDSLAKRQKAEKLKKKYKKKLDDLKVRYTWKSWRRWLEEQASNGSVAAQAAIEARGRVNFSEGSIKVEIQPVSMPRPVKITRRGTHIYADGSRRNGKTWIFRKGSDEGRLQGLLKLNDGKLVELQGGTEFQQQIFRLAKSGNVNLKFVPHEVQEEWLVYREGMQSSIRIPKVLMR